ncbi:MAG: hypothetical protein D6677_12405 [Calditrichaeota bacterium]|nr:MAG: hypothetical protein D6677_12405 [Calditrichota bacterium]
MESFLKNQKGYLDREPLSDENDHWFDILCRASMVAAQIAVCVMLQDSSSQGLIQMIHLVRQRAWGL